MRKHLSSQNLSQKAVSLIDNAPSHPASVLKSSDGMIFAKFLPPSITALVQPMDQGVIASIKRFYRSKLLKSKIEEGCDLKNFWKDYTILDCIYEIASACESVKPSTLTKSWKKLLPRVEKDENQSFINTEQEEVLQFTLVNFIKSVAGCKNVNENNLYSGLTVTPMTQDLST